MIITICAVVFDSLIDWDGKGSVNLEEWTASISKIEEGIRKFRKYHSDGASVAMQHAVVSLSNSILLCVCYCYLLK